MKTEGLNKSIKSHADTKSYSDINNSFYMASMRGNDADVALVMDQYIRKSNKESKDKGKKELV